MSDQAPSVPPAFQARSRATQDRIFTAGTRLLRERGPEALTVAAVAADAGVAVGSVYKRFGDKDRLLAAIQTRFTEEFGAELASRVADDGLVAGAPAANVIGSAVVGMAETFRRHASLLRVFMLLGTRDEAVFERGAQASREGGRIFRSTLMLAAPELRRHDDVEAAIDFAYRLTYAACSHRVTQGEHLESARALGWPELIEQIRLAVTAYLLCTPAQATPEPTFVEEADRGAPVTP